PQEAHALVAENKAVLIDVREEHELVESGMAEGALWMPTSLMDDDEPTWKNFKASLPKDKKVILYCRSGQRSGRVSEFLKDEGFDSFNAGGFKEWQARGLPLFEATGVKRIKAFVL
ncbi:MAG: rhodanese-like domain-containing protein, partial [Proteobacteria bacterium]